MVACICVCEWLVDHGSGEKGGDILCKVQYTYCWVEKSGAARGYIGYLKPGTGKRTEGSVATVYKLVISEHFIEVVSIFGKCGCSESTVGWEHLDGVLYGSGLKSV